MNNIGNHGWFKMIEVIPPQDMPLLGWDKRRGYSLCQWFPRKDFPNGQCWIVNGSSGGIGGPMEVIRPDYWQFLPQTPITA